jgi:hypothetical protein
MEQVLSNHGRAALDLGDATEMLPAAPSFIQAE